MKIIQSFRAAFQASLSAMTLAKSEFSLEPLEFPKAAANGLSGSVVSSVPSLDLSGKTELREALSIIANSKHVIGSDTGLVHGAEALGKNVSMILGPTSTETGAGVALADSENIQKDIWCRPCSQNGSTPCYRERQYCMESITPEEVLTSLRSNL